MEPKLDVFISYAHIDNQPLLADTQGWVTVFHDALQQLLSRFKGSSALIWRDPKLAGNDVLWQEIETRIAEAAALVTVLSPRYVASPSCKDEIQSFCRNAEHNGGLVVDHSARVFKVIKTPVEGGQDLPPIVGELLGYEFFRLDEGKTPQELDPLFGQEAREEFLRKVNKVAWDIKRLLDQLRRAAPVADAAREGEAKPVVYLAECSRDRRDARDNVEAELRRLGYVVLPDRQLPTDEAEYVAAVDALLERCAFSIHMIGAGYGLVPDGAGQKSIVVLQNERAAARFGSSGIRRVIWLPADLRAEHPLQQAFIDALHTSAQVQAGADLLTGDIEALKTTIRAHLKRIEQRQPPVQPPDEGGGGPRRIFLVCEVRDRLEVVPLVKALRTRGFEVSLPLFSGDAGQVREAFHEQASRADRVLVYYGAGDEAWKYHQLNELRKARGQQAGSDAGVCCTWVAPPATDDKTMLVMLADPGTIDATAGYSELALDTLLGTGRSTGAES